MMIRRIELAQAAGRALKSSAAPDTLTLTRNVVHLQSFGGHGQSANRIRSIVVRRAIGQSHCRAFATAAAASSTSTTTKKAAPKAAKPKSGTSTAARKSTSKTAGGAKKTAAKKPAAKKPKKRAVKPKAKPAPKKKVLTEKQKEAQTAKKGREHVAALKKVALLEGEPKLPIRTTWNALCAESLGKGNGTQTEKLKELAAQFKALGPAEIERLNHNVVEEQENYNTAYKKFLASHTPIEIRDANSARQSLKRLARKNNATTSKRKASGAYPDIVDPRIPKQPNTAYLLYSMERQNSGDFRNIAVSERAKLIGKEWAELGSSGKQKYEELQQADAQRYRREYKEAFGEEYTPSK